MISRMGQLPSRRTRPSHPIHSNNNNMQINPASINQPHRLLRLYMVRLQPRGPNYQVATIIMVGHCTLTSGTVEPGR